MRRESKLLFTKAVDSLVLILVNRVAYDLKVPLTDIALARPGESRRGPAQAPDRAGEPRPRFRGHPGELDAEVRAGERIR